jgi:Transposase C of IS166 homeodomain
MSATREEMLEEENRRLRQEIEAWQSQAQTWQSEKQAFQTRVQELESIRRNLEHTVAVYKRCLFGSRSEKIDPKELEARIAQAAAEAREQLAKEKRPGDPPPEPRKKSLKKKPRRTSPRTRRRNAKPGRTVAAVFQRICRVDESSTPSILRRPSARVVRIIRP